MNALITCSSRLVLTRLVFKSSVIGILVKVEYQALLGNDRQYANKLIFVTKQ